eukprot:3835635-Alexandrium_andersonii.AAC.1
MPLRLSPASPTSRRSSCGWSSLRRLRPFLRHPTFRRPRHGRRLRHLRHRHLWEFAGGQATGTTRGTRT